MPPIYSILSRLIFREFIPFKTDPSQNRILLAASTYNSRDCIANKRRMKRKRWSTDGTILTAGNRNTWTGTCLNATLFINSPT